jgi:hypothetical protein
LMLAALKYTVFLSSSARPTKCTVRRGGPGGSPKSVGQAPTPALSRLTPPVSRRTGSSGGSHHRRFPVSGQRNCPNVRAGEGPGTRGRAPGSSKHEDGQLRHGRMPVARRRSGNPKQIPSTEIPNSQTILSQSREERQEQ